MVQYPPKKYSDWAEWTALFSTLINAAPASYSILPAVATAYAALSASYVTAFNVANAPATRGPASIQTRVDALRLLKVSARSIVETIQASQSVTNTQRVSLGLKVRDLVPTPKPAPTTAPVVEVVSTTSTSVKVRIYEAGPGSKRKKAYAATGAVVMTYVGETVPAEPKYWNMEGTTSKNFFEVTFPEDIAPGSIVNVIAYWVNAKLEPGPACDPVRIRLAGKLDLGAEGSMSIAA